MVSKKRRVDNKTTATYKQKKFRTIDDNHKMCGLFQLTNFYELLMQNWYDSAHELFLTDTIEKKNWRRNDKWIELNLFTCFKCIGNFCHVTLFRTHSSISVFIFPLIDFCIVSNEIVCCLRVFVPKIVQWFCFGCISGCCLYHKFIINIQNHALIYRKMVSWSRWSNLVHQNKCKFATMNICVLFFFFNFYIECHY